ncbi:hypothetical protein [Sphaerisporangium dianthi]|uniref:Uncharacterized protein n=1 Tax=Sphaerisporangium dianthi TaxID=1436120 RepID=A0ABV9CQG6_9ACTN
MMKNMKSAAARIAIITAIVIGGSSAVAGMALADSPAPNPPQTQSATPTPTPTPTGDNSVPWG